MPVKAKIAQVATSIKNNVIKIVGDHKKIEKNQNDKNSDMLKKLTDHFNNGAESQYQEGN
jgi:phosphoglycerol transferase MdoB-like AlkP superfamily enzyme